MKIQPIPIAGIDITPPEVSRHHINATSTEISEQEEQLFDGDVFFLRHYGTDYTACNIYLKLYFTAMIPALQLLLEILWSHTHLFGSLKQAHLCVLSACSLNLL